MGIFRRTNLEEAQRVITPANLEDHRSSVDDIDKSLASAKAPEVKKWLESLKKKNLAKDKLFEIYDKMSEDSIVSAAIELVCDDVVKKDPLRNKVIWAQAMDDEDEDGNEDEQEASDAVNDFLKEYDMEEAVKTYVYQLVKYGEVFFKTYDSEFKSGNIPSVFADRVGTVFEMVDHPGDMIAVELFDTLCGFGKRKRNADDKPSEGYDFLSTDDYVYMKLDRKHVRQKVTLKWRDGDEEKTTDFKYIVPSSYLESARSAWAIMDLIETLLLYARFGHSDFFNLIQIEVGSAGRGETYKILRDIKRSFENQDSLDIKKNIYQGYSKPIPKNSNLYIPTRQGKGQVVVEPVQPAGDIKEIIDLEYWQDKLCAALRIPKAYLGLSDDNLTGIGNQSLTKMDVIYARLIQYIQHALILGVTDMVDFYLRKTEQEDYIGKYKIVMADPISVEQADWREDMTERVQLADQLNMYLSQIQGLDMSKVSPIILKAIVNLKEVSKDFDDLDSLFTADDSDVPVEPKYTDKAPVDLDVPIDFGGEM